MSSSSPSVRLVADGDSFPAWMISTSRRLFDAPPPHQWTRAALTLGWLTAALAGLFACRSPNTGPDGSWSGTARDAEGQWRVSIAFRTVAGTPTAASVDFPDVEGYGRRFTAASRGSTLHLERPQGNGRSIVLDATIRADSMTGTFVGLGVTAPFVLHRSRAPPEIAVESAAFANGPIRLGGSIYRPTTPGRHSAVVEIHGGGPDTRAKYESKAIFLARHGVVTLIYDKRGTGASSGEWETASMTDLAHDALAGAALVRTLGYVDPSRVGVEGFSQGGWIAPLASSLDPHVAFVIVGSAAGIDPMAQSIF